MDTTATPEEERRAIRDVSPGPSPAGLDVPRAGLLQDAPEALQAFERLERSPGPEGEPTDSAAPVAMGKLITNFPHHV